MIAGNPREHPGEIPIAPEVGASGVGPGGIPRTGLRGGLESIDRPRVIQRTPPHAHVCLAAPSFRKDHPTVRHTRGIRNRAS